jgi:hypothetical protein
MAMHDLYWELQDLLKRHGLIRVVRRTPKGGELEVWVQPDQGLRLEISSSFPSPAEIKKAVAEA